MVGWVVDVMVIPPLGGRRMEFAMTVFERVTMRVGKDKPCMQSSDCLKSRDAVKSLGVKSFLLLT